MKKIDIDKITNHCKFIMNEWKSLIDRAYGDTWRFLLERQLCRDVMESLKQNELIQDYNIGDLTIKTIEGEIISFKK